MTELTLMIMIRNKKFESLVLNFKIKMSQLQKLEMIINERKSRNSPSYSLIERNIRINERETLQFLVPIFDMLNDIIRRLEIIEKIQLEKMD